MTRHTLAIGIVLLAVAASGGEHDLQGLLQDRTAVERVYYAHRLGEKPAFEKVSPPELIERLVKDDLRKATALKQVYGVEISPALLDAEVQRINSTTRAPEVLAELKAALGNEPERFARAVAQPILVERMLRDKFDNDDSLHVVQRRQVEAARAQLLAAKQAGATLDKLTTQFKDSGSNQVSEATWQLGVRSAPTSPTESPDAMEIKKRFGPKAQLLSSPTPDAERKFYFDDLPAQLQQVLRAQLRQAGNVSAVIEMPAGFTLYLVRERTEEKLIVEVLSIPKRSYERWLDEQGGAK